MDKIKMTTPLVEMDGDEMTRVLWKWVKDVLILPFVDLKTEYYDLSIQNRDATDDSVTLAAAEACLKYGVGVKCATITPNTERVSEFNLKKLWSSPNATIRARLDGTVFRAPVLVEGITPLVPTWTKPIVIARHAYGDVYKGVEIRVEGGKAQLSCGDESKTVFDFGYGGGKAAQCCVESNKTAPDCENGGGNAGQCCVESNKTAFDCGNGGGKAAQCCVESNKTAFDCGNGGGIIQAQHNTDKSIFSFARSCFAYALSEKQDLWFSTKDTISKIYDRRFRDIFQEVYDNEYKEKFETNGLEYFYTLIDDAVARVMRSSGGYIWALKNYDGDVMSDMVATAFGSLAMMTSVLVSPSGAFEFEAAHGTVTRHYRKYQRGEETSTNSVATLFAWTGALKKRGELDGNAELVAFANKVEAATIKTIESGEMTKDLAGLFFKEGVTVKTLNSLEFLQSIAARL